jgi:hypothetical protein
MAGWHEWGEYKRYKAAERRRSRSGTERAIQWALPKALRPVRSEKVRWPGCPSGFTRWYVNGLESPQTFIYVLKEPDSGAVRYVGLTDDPPRRHMEHRRSKMLNGRYRMVVIAVGGPDDERRWIAHYLRQGCDLVNVVGARQGA